jgi:type 1 glutamine amidotransferase
MILFTRFRNLPDDQMQPIIDYVDSGKPIIGIRTATHAFAGISGKFAKYNYNSGDKSYQQGFGRQILGETWISHHGGHGTQSTRGILAPGADKHPILNGIKDGDIWGPTDVYGVRLPLPEGCEPLVLGQVLVGMKFDDKALEGKKNDPMMPIAWTRTLTTENRMKQRVFTSTLGASEDLVAEGSRRMFVNAAFWCLDMKAPKMANVDFVGEYKASRFRGDGFKRGVRPSQLSLK